MQRYITVRLLQSVLTILVVSIIVLVWHGSLAIR